MDYLRYYIVPLTTGCGALGFLLGGGWVWLGIATFRLSCGGFAWTHGGIAPGYVTYVGVTASGRAASIAVNSMVAEQSAAEHLDRSLDTALCR